MGSLSVVRADHAAVPSAHSPWFIFPSPELLAQAQRGRPRERSGRRGRGRARTRSPGQSWSPASSGPQITRSPIIVAPPRHQGRWRFLRASTRNCHYLFARGDAANNARSAPSP